MQRRMIFGEPNSGGALLAGATEANRHTSKLDTRRRQHFFVIMEAFI
jgi:hypothetical protein